MPDTLIIYSSTDGHTKIICKRLTNSFEDGDKKGGGKLIVKEVFKMIKKSNHLNRLVTLSPLTDMARNFHLKNGADEIQVNDETQNFEYKIIK